MSNENSINRGGLVNNSLFFGAALAEITSTALADIRSSWNGDSGYSVTGSNQWPARGGQSLSGSDAGTFAAWFGTGNSDNRRSHRTILLGY
ncbi:hypothetical protein FWG76_01840 [Candidatus Saccharibacteria bacterium]|nr:hypothetical protein [Candidatus Saccharibacteria bacterium]